MLSKRRFVTLSFLAFSLAACGDKKLNDADKREFFGALKAIEATAGDLYSANNMHAQGVPEGRGGGVRRAPLVDREFADGVETGISYKPSPSGLSFQVANASCDFLSTGKDPFVAGMQVNAMELPKSGEIQITGPSCPIAFKLSMRVKSPAEQALQKSDLTLDYSVLQEPMKAFSDLTAMALSASVESNPSPGAASLQLSFSGDVQSQNYGLIKLAGSQSQKFSQGEGMSTSTSGDFKFAKFTAHVEHLKTLKPGANDPVEEYKLNGEKMESGEFSSRRASGN